MSKGIIVVDIPENCLNCGCKLCFDRSYYCGAKARYLDDWEFDIQNEKPEICMSKKYEANIYQVICIWHYCPYKRKKGEKP